MILQFCRYGGGERNSGHYWFSSCLIVQSALNMTISYQKSTVAAVIAFTSLEPSPAVSTFLCLTAGKPVIIPEAIDECALNFNALENFKIKLNPMVQTSLIEIHRRAREDASKGRLSNFTKGDHVLVAREDFTAGKNLSLHWCGPQRILEALLDHVFQVKYFCNERIQDVHRSRLKHFSDSSLNEKAIMSHVLSPITAMPVARLPRLQDCDSELKVHECWKGLFIAEDTLELRKRVYENIPQIVVRLLERKNTLAALASHTYCCFCLWRKKGWRTKRIWLKLSRMQTLNCSHWLLRRSSGTKAAS